MSLANYISDETFDLMRERWAEQIPSRYRCAGHEAPNPTTSAIIAAPPPAALLFKFFFLLPRMHLTREQRRFQAEKEGRRRNGDAAKPKVKPPSVSISVGDLEEVAIDIPFL